MFTPNNNINNNINCSTTINSNSTNNNNSNAQSNMNTSNTSNNALNSSPTHPVSLKETYFSTTYCFIYIYLFDRLTNWKFLFFFLTPNNNNSSSSSNNLGTRIESIKRWKNSTRSLTIVWLVAGVAVTLSPRTTMSINNCNHWLRFTTTRVITLDRKTLQATAWIYWNT